MEKAKPIEQRKQHSQLRGPSKTFQQDGHWIEKPHKTTVHLCECGTKYLKTRTAQDKCLRCFFAPPKGSR